MTAEPKKSNRYNAREAEARWQKIWDARGIFATANDPPARERATADEPARPPAGRSLGESPKYYALEIFFYPSGRIHMGQET